MNHADLERSAFVNFPRLAELREAVEAVTDSAYDGWFANLPQKVSGSHLAMEWYERLERELSLLDTAAWDTFKMKIAGPINSTRRELISLMNEAAGYARLKEMLSKQGIPYNSIQQPIVAGTKKKKIKEPEWIALFGNEIVAAIEVKTVFESDDQNAFIKTNTNRLQAGLLPDVGMLTPSIHEGLFNKCMSHVKNAKEQLRSVHGQPKLLVAYVIVNVDYEASQFPDCLDVIKTYLNKLCESDVLVVSDVRSSYF